MPVYSMNAELSNLINKIYDDRTVITNIHTLESQQTIDTIELRTKNDKQINKDENNIQNETNDMQMVMCTMCNV